MWESFSLSRASSIRRSTSSSYEWVRLFLSEVERQSSHVRSGILLMSVDTTSNDEEDKRYVPTRRGMEPPKEGRAPNNYQTKAARGQRGERQSEDLMTQLRVRHG